MTYKELLQERRERYFKTKLTYCPCLKCYIAFNARGFYHLRYHASGKQRSVKEQMYKLGLFPLAVPVIRNARKIDFYEQRDNVTVRRKKGKKKKNAEYWTLKERVGKRDAEVKVILRRVGNGIIHFWSIMKVG